MATSCYIAIAVGHMLLFPFLAVAFALFVVLHLETLRYIILLSLLFLRVVAIQCFPPLLIVAVPINLALENQQLVPEGSP